MSRTLSELAATVSEEMPAKVSLVYVDYRDEFTADQIRALVRCDIDSLSESVWDWESEAQWNSACDLVDELATDILRRWEREDDADYDNLLEYDWPPSDERESAIDDIRNRDDSDVLKELAGHSGYAFLRMPIEGLGEDESMDDIDETEFLRRAGLSESETNLRHARELLAETSYPGAVRMGYVLAAISVGDIYALPFDPAARVTIRNPHIYFGNPFAGSGWAAGPFDGEFTYRRDELRTDRDAFGYSWEEIAGPIVSAYEAEIGVAE